MEQEALIQKYIQGSLNEAEQAQFEALLKNDLDFAKKVAEHENVHKALKAHERDELKSHLQQFDAAQQKNETPKKSLKGTIRLAIAVVALLVVGLIGNYMLQQANMNETLYATYFEPYPNALQPVTRGQSDTSKLSKATQAYEAKRYEEAIAAFDAILAEDENIHVEVLFYKAMSLLNLGKETEAITILRSIKHEKTRFTPQIYWYGALIHIKFKENEKALKALEYMDSIKTTYKAKERAILKEKLK